MENCSVMEIQNLVSDRILSRACLKSLEIIGEASRNISQDLKKAHPEIPWRQMTGMRDKLVHHYFGVDWEIVDDVLRNELPDLRSNVLRLLSELERSRPAVFQLNSHAQTRD
jgi:uncharacterized protein with HEPN domain